MKEANQILAFGGESLEGSGFEAETPEDGFAGFEIQIRSAGEAVIGDGFLRRLFQE